MIALVCSCIPCTYMYAWYFQGKEVWPKGFDNIRIKLTCKVKEQVTELFGFTSALP